MAEPTEAQKELARQYEAEQRERAEQDTKNEKNKKIVAAEVDMLIKFLNANGLKKKKVIFAPNGRHDDKTFAQEYFTGKK